MSGKRRKKANKAKEAADEEFELAQAISLSEQESEDDVVLLGVRIRVECSASSAEEMGNNNKDSMATTVVGTKAAGTTKRSAAEEKEATQRMYARISHSGVVNRGDVAELFHFSAPHCNHRECVVVFAFCLSQPFHE